jgi:hypothetical protein
MACLRLIDTAAGGALASASWLRISGATTILGTSNGQDALVDTTSSAFTVKLPDPAVVGDAFQIGMIDVQNKWPTHNLSVSTTPGTVPIVDPNGVGTTGATGTTIVLNAARASVTFKLAKPENIYVVK